MQKIWDSLKQRWFARKLHDKFYLAALVLLLLPFLLMLFRVNNATLIDIASTPSFLCFVIGYITWWIPKFLRMWRSDIGRLPLIWLNALLFPISAGLARAIVSKAVGLPPQSLDLTVSLLAILSFPVLWGALFYLTSVVHAVAILFIGMFFTTAEGVSNSMSFSTSNANNDASEEGSGRWLVNHGIGGLLTGVFIGFAIWGYTTSVYSGRFVRLAAYCLDFEYAAQYPGIDHNRRMRLLDNQYAAYAEFDWPNINITVDKLHN
ncbi:hypothetical protein PQR14_36080 [Paraburkholderia bryophila]|uniref:hypothetical protein n=1 Tax=Paraburkholderia bryophila TaxID=420952 RepID=UPI0038BD3628